MSNESYVQLIFSNGKPKQVRIAGTGSVKSDICLRRLGPDSLQVTTTRHGRQPQSVFVRLGELSFALRELKRLTDRDVPS